MHTSKSDPGPGRPRVVLATRTFLPEPLAAALRLGALSSALARTGARVRVLTSRSPGQDAWSAPAGVEVHRAPVLRDATGAVRGYVPYMSFDMPLFVRLLTMPHADVVVNEPPPTTGVVTRLACGLRRTPYVYFAGDIVSDAAQAQGTSGVVVTVVRAMERFALRGASEVVAVSQGVADRVRAISGRGAVVVPNGIDTSAGLPATNVPPADFPAGGGPVFLYAGTVAPWLGAEIFLQAWPRVRRTLPEATLVYLGQGGGWESLVEQAAGVPGVVTHEAVPPDEVSAWYAAADVALASLRPGGYDYAYPTKILSALAQGTPVVYAGEGAARSDVQENQLGNAAAFRVEAVAHAMIDLATAPAGDSRRDRERLFAWVDRNRSVHESSARVAQVVLRTAKRGRGRLRAPVVR
ncbi:MAG: glycosyltransferase [Pauljensenia sp.]